MRSLRASQTARKSGVNPSVPRALMFAWAWSMRSMTSIAPAELSDITAALKGEAWSPGRGFGSAPFSRSEQAMSTRPIARAKTNGRRQCGGASSMSSFDARSCDNTSSGVALFIASTNLAQRALRCRSVSFAPRNAALERFVPRMPTRRGSSDPGASSRAGAPSLRGSATLRITDGWRG